MVMLSMRPADVAGLSIDKYDTSNEIWYKSNNSWYCTGYSKIKDETGSEVRTSTFSLNGKRSNTSKRVTHLNTKSDTRTFSLPTKKS